MVRRSDPRLLPQWAGVTPYDLAMRRLLLIVPLALVFTALPAYADFVTHHKESSCAESASQSLRQESWIKNDDQGTQNTGDDRIRFNALPGQRDTIAEIGAYNNAATVRFFIWKLDGPNSNNHTLEIGYIRIPDEPYENFDWDGNVDPIDRDRKPYLEVRVDWNNGNHCSTFTAWLDGWKP